MKAFKKGDAVTVLGNWDSKGTVYIHNAIVHSCGAKRMILTDAATGEEMGHEFAPVRGDVFGLCGVQVFPALDAREAREMALFMAHRKIDAERERFERIIARDGADTRSARYIEQQIAALHEPRAEYYERLRREIADRVRLT